MQFQARAGRTGAARRQKLQIGVNNNDLELNAVRQAVEKEAGARWLCPAGAADSMVERCGSSSGGQLQAICLPWTFSRC